MNSNRVWMTAVAFATTVLFSQSIQSADADTELNTEQDITHAVIVIDSTMSMGYPIPSLSRTRLVSRQAAAASAAAHLLDILPVGTNVSVVAIQDEVSVLRTMKPLTGKDRSTIGIEIRALSATGSTKLEKSFATIEHLLTRTPEGKLSEQLRRSSRPLVVVITDGDNCDPVDAQDEAKSLSDQFEQGMKFLVIGCVQNNSPTNCAKALHSLAISGGGDFGRITSTTALGAFAEITQLCIGMRARKAAARARVPVLEQLLATAKQQLVASETLAEQHLRTIAEREQHIAELEGIEAGLKRDVAESNRRNEAANGEITKAEKARDLHALNAKQLQDQLTDEKAKFTADLLKLQNSTNEQIKQFQADIAATKKLAEDHEKSRKEIDPILKQLGSLASSTELWTTEFGIGGVLLALVLGGWKTFVGKFKELTQSSTDQLAGIESGFADRVKHFEATVEEKVNKAIETSAANAAALAKSVDGASDQLKKSITANEQTVAEKLASVEKSVQASSRSEFEKIRGGLDSLSSDAANTLKDVQQARSDIQQHVSDSLAPINATLKASRAELESVSKDVRLDFEAKTNGILQEIARKVEGSRDASVNAINANMQRLEAKQDSQQTQVLGELENLQTQLQADLGARLETIGTEAAGIKHDFERLDERRSSEMKSLEGVVKTEVQSITRECEQTNHQITAATSACVDRVSQLVREQAATLRQELRPQLDSIDADTAEVKRAVSILSDFGRSHEQLKAEITRLRDLCVSDNRDKESRVIETFEKLNRLSTDLAVIGNAIQHLRVPQAGVVSPSPADALSNSVAFMPNVGQRPVESPPQVAPTNERERETSVRELRRPNGIGKVRANQLFEAGIRNLEQLANLSEQERKTLGYSITQIEDLSELAREYLAEQNPAAESSDSAPSVATTEPPEYESDDAAADTTNPTA